MRRRDLSACGPVCRRTTFDGLSHYAASSLRAITLDSNEIGQMTMRAVLVGRFGLVRRQRLRWSWTHAGLFVLASSAITSWVVVGLTSGAALADTGTCPVAGATDTWTGGAGDGNWAT